VLGHDRIVKMVFVGIGMATVLGCLMGSKGLGLVKLPVTFFASNHQH
jgi:hypothetical protein